MVCPPPNNLGKSMACALIEQALPSLFFVPKAPDSDQVDSTPQAKGNTNGDWISFLLDRKSVV